MPKKSCASGLSLRAPDRRPDPVPPRHPPAGLRAGPGRVAPRRRPGAGRPAPRCGGRGARPVPGGLQRLGLLGRGGPPGGATGARGPAGARLGLAVGARAQVSCNLIHPDRVRAGPSLRRGGRPGRRGGAAVEGGELVGLIPEVVSWPPCPPAGEPSSASQRRRRWRPGSWPVGDTVRVCGRSRGRSSAGRSPVVRRR